ncbi:AI-2E family transporter, partial [Streptomyces sp. MBT67]|nr:AI-2E family transporter [Streptomyces sp. MBT67]
MSSTDESAPAQPSASPPAPPAAPPASPSGSGGVRMPGWLPRAMVLALALYACFQLG